MFTAKHTDPNNGRTPSPAGAPEGRRARPTAQGGKDKSPGNGEKGGPGRPPPGPPAGGDGHGWVVVIARENTSGGDPHPNCPTLTGEGAAARAPNDTKNKSNRIIGLQRSAANISATEIDAKPRRTLQP